VTPTDEIPAVFASPALNDTPNGTAAHASSTVAPAVQRNLIRFELPATALLDEFEAKADRKHKRYKAGRRQGPGLNLPSVDREIGYLPNGLNVLQSNTGTGKSALAEQACTTADHPSLYVLCEMTPDVLLQRLIARVTDTFMNKLTLGQLPAAEVRQKAEQALASLKAPFCVLYDRPGPSLDRIREAAEMSRGTEPDTDLLIVIDSVHSWVRSNPDLWALNEYEALGMALNGLNQLGETLGCPVLGLAERSRAAMKDGGVNGAAGHRAFEYLCNTMLELDYAKRAADAPRNGPIEVQLVISKNRMGGAAGRSVKLQFHGAVQRFEEVSS
jgi:replicative DNA helicase